MPLQTVSLAIVTLPVLVIEREEYARSLPEARRRIARRDPDDVDVLALALHLGVDVWSTTATLTGLRVAVLERAALASQTSPPRAAGLSCRAGGKPPVAS